MTDRATEIEVIDQYNARHRFDAKTHAWQWGILAGTIDADDHGIVEIIMLSEDDDEDGAVICTFPNPAKVGICRKDTCQILPMREIESKSYRAGYAACQAEVVREQEAEIATLRAQVADRKDAVCLQPCAKHAGIPFQTTVMTVSILSFVCPHCEKENKGKQP